MNVFICGGAGFLGSHLTGRHLADPKVERVVVYDNFSSGSRQHLSAYKGSSKLIVVEGDINQAELLRESMKGADVVYHLAANPDIARAAVEPDIDFYRGTLLTQIVVEAMRVNKVGKIFYTSGSGVYGENAAVSFREDHGPLEPISTYGASKLASEALICSYCHMFGLVARVFRFANVVGPRQTHGVGFDFLRRLKQDPTRLRILGDGTQSKSYIHVDDVLDAIHYVDDRADSKFCVHNVATGDYITVTDIARLAVEVSGLDPAKVAFEYTGGDRGWNGDVPVIRFDLSKLARLGWKSSLGSREAFRRSLEAMQRELASKS